MHIKFKTCIPPADSAHHSLHTIRIYNKGRFVDDSMMHYDLYIELWTAPRISDNEEPSSKTAARMNRNWAVRIAQNADWRAH